MESPPTTREASPLPASAAPAAPAAASVLPLMPGLWEVGCLLSRGPSSAVNSMTGAGAAVSLTGVVGWSNPGVYCRSVHQYGAAAAGRGARRHRDSGLASHRRTAPAAAVPVSEQRSLRQGSSVNSTPNAWRLLGTVQEAESSATASQAAALPAETKPPESVGDASTEAQSLTPSPSAHHDGGSYMSTGSLPSFSCHPSGDSGCEGEDAVARSRSRSMGSVDERGNGDVGFPDDNCWESLRSEGGGSGDVGFPNDNCCLDSLRSECEGNSDVGCPDNCWDSPTTTAGTACAARAQATTTSDASARAAGMAHAARGASPPE